MGMLERRLRKARTSLQRLPGKITFLKRRLQRSIGRDALPPVCFRISGGMGDHVVAARFIRDLSAHLGGVRFDVFTKRVPLTRWLFAGLPGCSEIHQEPKDYKYVLRQYALALDVNVFAVLRHAEPKRIEAALARRIRSVLESLDKKSAPIRMYIEHHPRLDGYLGHYAAIKGLKRHNFPHDMAGIPYGGDALTLDVEEEAPRKAGLPPGGYITVSNGYDEQMVGEPGAVVTKVYPHYAELIRLLKARHPGLTVVQIGSASSTPIPGIDLDLVGKTTLQEVAGLLRHALLHVDGEGGLVHLARALGTGSCVLFGPTLSSYFGYEGNLNIDPPVCGGCWWMERDWMVKCVKGERRPPCMFQQKPQAVALQVSQVLEKAERLLTARTAG